LGSPDIGKQGTVEAKDSPNTIPVSVDQASSPTVARNTRDAPTVDLQTPSKVIPATPCTVSTDNGTYASSVAATISVATGVDNGGELALNTSMDNEKYAALPPPDRVVKMVDVVASPLFSDVRALLERGGYIFSGTSHDDGPCHRPCGRAFTNVQELQRDLCAYGVDCQYGGSVQRYAAACQCWNDAEKATLHRWVRDAVIRGPRRTGVVEEVTLYQLLQFGERLGFSCMAGSGDAPSSFYFPDGVTRAASIKDLLESLSRFGLPDDCLFGQLSEEERLGVEYCLANYCPLAGTL
jgi:hypothetical protein